MKILAIGDFHGKFPSKLKKAAKEADLVLCTGDLGGSDKLLKVIFKYFYQNWWEKVGKKKAKELVMEDYNSGKKILKELSNLGKPVYLIEGNWDFEEAEHKERTGGLKLRKYSDLIKKKKDIIFLRKRMKKINGLKLYAFGGRVTPTIYLTDKEVFDKEDRVMFKKKYEKQKKQLFKIKDKDIDFFLSHYTPFGYFDIVRYKGENPMNGKHVGFKPYTDFIKKYQPKLFICGHMHEYQGKKKIGNTLIIATGSAKEGKAALIDYDKEKKKVKKVKFLK